VGDIIDRISDWVTKGISEVQRKQSFTPPSRQRKIIRALHRSTVIQGDGKWTRAELNEEFGAATQKRRGRQFPWMFSEGVGGAEGKGPDWGASVARGRRMQWGAKRRQSDNNPLCSKDTKGGNAATARLARLRQLEENGAKVTRDKVGWGGESAISAKRREEDEMGSTYPPYAVSVRKRKWKRRIGGKAWGTKRQAEPIGT